MCVCVGRVCGGGVCCLVLLLFFNIFAVSFNHFVTGFHSLVKNTSNIGIYLFCYSLKTVVFVLAKQNYIYICLYICVHISVNVESMGAPNENGDLCVLVVLFQNDLLC